MNPILLIVDLLALLFAMVLIYVLPRRFKLLFLAGATIPLLSMPVVYFMASDGWGLKEIGMWILRGGFILSVFLGTLSCYFSTWLSLRKKGDR